MRNGLGSIAKCVGVFIAKGVDFDGLAMGRAVKEKGTGVSFGFGFVCVQPFFFLRQNHKMA